MKRYRIMTLVAVAMLAMVAMAQQASLTVNDEKRHQTITVTVVDDDVVRVDVVPDSWNGQRLPTLVHRMKMTTEAKVEKWGDDINVLRTAGGMKVVILDGGITVGNGNEFFITDLCDRSSNTV